MTCSQGQSEVRFLKQLETLAAVSGRLLTKMTQMAMPVPAVPWTIQVFSLVFTTSRINTTDWQRDTGFLEQYPKRH